MIRRILALTRHEIRLFVQKPSRFAVLLLVPLVFVAVMGQTFGGGDLPTVAVFAVDEDQSRASARVMDALEDVKTLDLTLLDSRADADRRIGEGERMAAIVVPAGFSEALTTDTGGAVEVIVDPARDQMAGVVVGQVQAATVPMLIDAEISRGVDRAFSNGPFNDADVNLGDADVEPGSVQRFLTAALQGIIASEVERAMDEPLVSVDMIAAGDPEHLVEQPTLLDYLVPGYTFFFGFFLVGMMVESVFGERAGGTLRRLLTTPARRAAILLGKVVPFFVLAVAQMAAVLAFSTLFFEFDMGRSPVALALVIGATALAISGLGVMLSTVVRSQGQAKALPDLLVIAMAAVSGMMFPSIRLPVVEMFTPNYWALRGFQDVVTRNQGVEAVALEVGVLLGMAALFFLIGVRRFRFE